MLKILFFSLALSSTWAHEPAPTETLTCLVGAQYRKDQNSSFPMRIFHPQTLVLASHQSEVFEAWPFVEIKIRPDAAPLYSEWALGPLENLTPSEARLLFAQKEIDRPPARLRLNRFASTDERAAGFSIEVYIPGGYYLGSLHRPEAEGEHFMLQTPIRSLEDSTIILGWILVTCSLSPAGG